MHSTRNEANGFLFVQSLNNAERKRRQFISIQTVLQILQDFPHTPAGFIAAVHQITGSGHLGFVDTVY